MATNTIKGLNRNYAAITGCMVVFTAGAVVTVAMRIFSKALTKTSITGEDYSVFLATAMLIVTEGLMMKAVTVGRHSQTLNDPEDMVLSKMVYIYSISGVLNRWIYSFYFAIIALCIVSILLLYRRIFIKPFVRHATIVLFIITVCWWISCTTIEIGYYSLLPETFPGYPKHTSLFRVNYIDWWLAAGVIEQVIIVAAVMLPIREVYQLQVPMSKRLGLMFMFAISYICIGTGIARLATLYRPDQKNVDVSIGDIWISAHLGTAIMSVNLPVCWPALLWTARCLGISRGLHHRHHRVADERWENGWNGGREMNAIAAAESYDPHSSEAGSVLEAMTMGPTTKDGRVRNEMMARAMGMNVIQEPSDAGKVSEPGRAVTNEENRGRTKILPRWLELKLVDWRMSIGGSMFLSQRSKSG